MPYTLKYRQVFMTPGDEQAETIEVAAPTLARAIAECLSVQWELPMGQPFDWVIMAGLRVVAVATQIDRYSPTSGLVRVVFLDDVPRGGPAPYLASFYAVEYVLNTRGEYERTTITPT